MPLLALIANTWQKALPVLAVAGILAWLAAFRHAPTTDRALFAALLVIYMLHQIEEHLWPGGFRQFTNRHVFRSGDDDWPVDCGGVALVNIGYVWLPLALAVAWPGALRWLGLGWVGLTLVNALSLAAGVRSAPTFSQDWEKVPFRSAEGRMRAQLSSRANAPLLLPSSCHGLTMASIPERSRPALR